MQADNPLVRRQIRGTVLYAGLEKKRVGKNGVSDFMAERCKVNVSRVKERRDR